ncbi:MAG: M20 family peptidase [Saprospiraceae bacterium]
MKRLLRLLMLPLLGLVLVLLVNTIRFSSKQIQVEPITVKPLDEAPVQRLAEAVRFQTISDKLDQDSSAFWAFDQWIEQTFPLVDSLLNLEKHGDLSRLYHWPGKNPNLNPVMLIAHLDVVAVQEASAWEQPAFEGVIEDGFIWGRGTLDDKVSVLGILEAAELLLAEGYTPERNLYFGFGHDEEVGGTGAQTMAAALKAKGVELEYILDEGYYVIEEALPGLAEPLAIIGLSEKGYVTLSLDVQMQEGGHSSMPPKETAIGVLSAAVQKLEQEPFPAKIQGPLKDMFRYAGPEMSPVFKVVMANLWLTGGILINQLEASPASNALLRTTTAPTIIEAGLQENVLPTQGQAIVNFRIIPGETAESVKQRVEDLVGSEFLSVNYVNSGIFKDPSPVSSTDAFGFQVISKTIREIFPEAVVAPGVMVGAADVSYYSDVSDQLYRFLPLQLTQPDLKRIHGNNERIGVEQYKKSIRFYEQLIRNSCK